ncbi:DNA-directed RNA polymerases II 24 kDa polypeptide (RNA polymerase II subunit 5) [Coemansia aciculifera]|uniref:DNA-directed RNA polymerases I, II, and III subunit RPABC1 n=2 Tax=Coemansia TaxID=4863 RepID=A0A9W8GTY4_9FUNG|nr:DNA-directed RNA polymerases II 24 kDa polypeptide (RNA polymerase II subunit 5) [Coemansia pectinata]KAJ2863576.1 DNA-directed RNA polymerases II 24 kDa polypeptide (RNA polymerase II subunit 5) [Coemansia aciculifera]KAJ2870705.1 DNA-directed RNA polymerases II 24 kDa polypeptide (RNA polymerase II subunit 5) [Coemansia aciculifera]KAJ2881986.1 DNA-directed RNA polymerases II 24 kDa polypeptide (RNA polymerase II subunit 5) [Coemansia aciculifera]
MDADAREITRLWRVYRTVHQLSKDRNYLVASADLERSLDKFKAEYAPNGKVDRARLTFVVQKKDDPTSQMFVFFPDHKSVGITPIKEYISKMAKESVSSAIIVYRHTLTSMASKLMSEFSGKYRMEKFNEADLLVNITEHELVPQHKVLNDEQKKEILKRYRLKETQLPRIQQEDPVARYYGMCRGQVVQIIRPSETAGRYVTYRMCM